MKSETYTKEVSRFRAKLAAADNATILRLLNFLEACDHGLILTKDVQIIADVILTSLNKETK